jgi:DNA-directed RNA polymerase specialized sigma24 family protein
MRNLAATRPALAALPARRRACVLLRLGYDLPERDVAVLLGIGVGTVKIQTSRGPVQLAAALTAPMHPDGGSTGRTAA